MWSLIQEVIKDIDSLIRKPYLPSKKGLAEIRISDNNYRQHCDKQNELRRLLAEAYCNVSVAVKSGASSEEILRLQKIENERFEEVASSELDADNLRLETTLIAWKVHGTKRARLLKIIEDAEKERIEAPLSHEVDLQMRWEETMKKQQNEKVANLDSLLKALDRLDSESE
jgi:hypothetical protein